MQLPIYDTSDVSPQRFEVEAEKISPLRSYIMDTRIVVWKYLDSVEVGLILNEKHYLIENDSFNLPGNFIKADTL